MSKFDARVVDQLGILLAQKADLDAQIDAIKTHLREQGEGAYEGELYRATVSTQERSTLDLKAVRAKLSDQFIRAHTNVTESVVVKCVARNGIKVAA